MTMKGDARRMEPTLAAEGSCPDTGVPDASELVGNVASVGEGAGSDIVEAEPAGESGDVVKDITAHSRATMLADLARLDGLLATVERGFAAVSQGDELAGRNGAPVRHDALQMGLEGLKILWTQYRRDEATQSLGEDGFAALALAMFGAKAVGFDDGTVMGAVVDFLPRNKSERSADWDTKIFDAFCERALKL
ncbi:hypothetical protein ROS9278_00702 [Roseomonas sp. CECT 9278]|nr:hypothetical protein ROS9278_00702 [Roseomonas sp. CECT 9278]